MISGSSESVFKFYRRRSNVDFVFANQIGHATSYSEARWEVFKSYTRLRKHFF